MAQRAACGFVQVWPLQAENDVQAGAFLHLLVHLEFGRIRLDLAAYDDNVAGHKGSLGLAAVSVSI